MRSLALVALLLAGCVQTRATPLGSSAVRPTVPADSVAVYRTAEQVPRKYTEVALLEADGGDIYRQTALLKKLREKAGALGANGLLLLEAKEPTTATGTVSSNSSPVAVVESTSGSYRVKVVAIYIEP